MSADPRDQEVVRLRAELATAQTALARAVAELAEFRVKFDLLVAQGAKTNDQLAELVAAAKRTGRSAPRPPAPAAPPELDDAARQAYENRPTAPKLPQRDKPPKKPHKPTGRKPLPKHLPADEHFLRPEACEHCGGTRLDQADEVVEEKLDFVEAYQRRRVVRRKTCRCRDCGGRTTPRSLPAPYERSKVTSAWLAWLVYMKFAMLVPLDRLRRELQMQGIPLAPSTLVGFIERAADLLAPVDGYQWQQLLKGRWMATDATGLKVLVPNLKSAHNGYIEVFRCANVVVFQRVLGYSDRAWRRVAISGGYGRRERTPYVTDERSRLESQEQARRRENNLTPSQYEASKDGETVAKKLAPFKGTLVADAEHRYNSVYADGTLLEAGCNAHGRRKFEDAEKVQPVLAAEGGAFISAMYVAEDEAREAR